MIELLAPVKSDPHKVCRGCGAAGFMELFQVEVDEYAWRCECGHEEPEDFPEKRTGWSR